MKRVRLLWVAAFLGIGATALAAGFVDRDGVPRAAAQGGAVVFVLSEDAAQLPADVENDEVIDPSQIAATFGPSTSVRALVVSTSFLQSVTPPSQTAAALRSVLANHHILFVVEGAASDFLVRLGYLEPNGSGGLRPPYNSYTADLSTLPPAALPDDPNDDVLEAGIGYHLAQDGTWDIIRSAGPARLPSLEGDPPEGLPDEPLDPPYSLIDNVLGYYAEQFSQGEPGGSPHLASPEELAKEGTLTQYVDGRPVAPDSVMDTGENPVWGPRNLVLVAKEFQPMYFPFGWVDGKPGCCPSAGFEYETRLYAPDAGGPQALSFASPRHGDAPTATFPYEPCLNYWFVLNRTHTFGSSSLLQDWFRRDCLLEDGSEPPLGGLYTCCENDPFHDPLWRYGAAIPKVVVGFEQFSPPPVGLPALQDWEPHQPGNPPLVLDMSAKLKAGGGNPVGGEFGIGWQWVISQDIDLTDVEFDASAGRVFWEFDDATMDCGNLTSLGCDTASADDGVHLPGAVFATDYAQDQWGPFCMLQEFSVGTRWTLGIHLAKFRPPLRQFVACNLNWNGGFLAYFQRDDVPQGCDNASNPFVTLVERSARVANDRVPSAE